MALEKLTVIVLEFLLAFVTCKTWLYSVTQKTQFLHPSPRQIFQASKSSSVLITLDISSFSEIFLIRIQIIFHSKEASKMLGFFKASSKILHVRQLPAL